MSQPSASLNSNAETQTGGTELALPLAAIISLVISCYVCLVLVGVVFRQSIVQVCCSGAQSSSSCSCDIFPNSCCKVGSIGCCNAESSRPSCFESLLCCCSYCSSSEPADCQSCDCCCFEIACHLKHGQTIKSNIPT